MLHPADFPTLPSESLFESLSCRPPCFRGEYGGCDESYSGSYAISAGPKIKGRLRAASWVAVVGQSSRVTPIFTRTCQWAILPFSMWPRVSITSNYRILLSLISALAMAF